MEATSQKSGVIKATGQVTKIVSGKQTVLNKEQKKQVCTIIIKMFETGELIRKSEKSGESIEQYTSGLVSNHLRKAKELNGDTKYEPKEKRPEGYGNPIVRELRKLLKSKEGTPDEARVQKALDSEVEKWESEKKSKKSAKIDFDLIPEFKDLAS